MRTALKVALAVALLLAAGLWVDRRLHGPLPPPAEAELQALRVKRDALQAELRDTVAEAGERSLASAPRAGVMIGIPTSVAERVVGQVVTGLFGKTTLTLENLRAHKQGEVKTKLLIRKKKVGAYALEVQIHEIHGLLRPGQPELSFGRNRIGVALPVSIAGGEGRAELFFHWDSKGLAANAVCGDVTIIREVTGRVVPKDYRLEGSFGIAAEGQAIVLRPDFGELQVRLFVDPTEQAWGVVDGVIAEQPAVCRAILEKIDLKSILGRVVGKGFNVKIPKQVFKPVRFPAGLRASLDLQGVRLDLSVAPTALLVAEERLWYGADLKASRASRPADASR